MCGKLAAAEVRGGKALAFSHAARDDVLKLAGVIAGCCFFRQHLELRFDDIVDICQHHGGALDDLFRRDEVRLIFLALRDAHGGAPENFATSLRRMVVNSMGFKT